MSFTNDLKVQMDLPVWEHCRFAPTASSALSGWCAGEELGNRYIYYLVSTLFYRYDTITEAWQQLASPITAAVSLMSLRYSSYGGYRGNVLGWNTDKITIAGYSDGRFLGKKIRIYDGTGKGQERTITSIGPVVIEDTGLATAAGATLLTDTTKKWAINQFIGHQCRITYNTGLSQVRRILYNNTNTLYFQDNNYQQLDPWQNIAFTVAPVVTAGNNAHFTIECVELTVDTPWTVVLDASSSYVMMTGGIWMISSAAAAPWATLQYYDVATDIWSNRTSPGGLFVAAYGTDACLERTGEIGGAYLTGTATSATNRSLVDTSKTMVTNRYRNYQIRITGGTGIGQKKSIAGNIGTTFFIESTWEITPDATSTYSIFGNSNRIYLAGGGLSTMLKYHTEYDNWIQGPLIDAGVVGAITAQYPSQQPFAIASGVRGTTGVTGLAAAPTAGGTGYTIGTILTLTGPTNAQAIVTSESGGVVTGIALFRCGTGATVASGIATTAATGSGCTVQVTSVGTIGRMTTSINHNLATADSVTIKGCTDDAWNTTYTLLATDTLTTFDILITAAATAVATTAHSVTVIVDASKNWVINELAGALVQITIAGPSPTTQLRRIVSNTATAITVALAITAVTEGASRYIIYQPWLFGREEQYKVDKWKGNGYATGGSTTTLIDSTKTWNFGQWVGYKFRIISGTGYGSGDIAITGHTATTLTFATQTFTPDATTQYVIMDTFGLCGVVTNTTNATITDTTKVWGVNALSGKRLRITSGTGQSQEITITSNTVNVITCTGVFTTAPDTNSTYCILAVPPKGAGMSVQWIYGNTNTDTKGKYILIPRGGLSNVIDRYDITTDLYELIEPISPQMETFTTGAMYAYDGKDTLICHSYLAGVTKLFTLNTENGIVDGCGNPPITNGTACLGNRLEIVTTIDGVEFLYIMRHTGQEIARTPLWWLQSGKIVEPVL